MSHMLGRDHYQRRTVRGDELVVSHPLNGLYGSICLAHAHQACVDNTYGGGWWMGGKVWTGSMGGQVAVGGEGGL